MYKYAVKKDEEGMEATYGLHPSIGALSLQGVPFEDQLYAMKDRNELSSASLKGMGVGGLAGAILGGLTAYGLGGGLSSPQKVPPFVLSLAAGAGLGGLSGYLIGNRNKYKELAKRKGTDEDYDLRHVPLWGSAAQLAALQGLPEAQQVDANIDAIKMHIPGAAAGMLAYYPTLGTGTAGAVLSGREWAYNKIKKGKK